MKPIFKLLADDNDITAMIKDRLLLLNLQDNSGLTNDTLTITLDDRASEIALPRGGVEIECFLGYGDTLYSKGSFEVDEIIERGAPEQITIIAKASRINRSLKQARTQTYENITLGALVETIASRNSMEAKVSEFLASIEIAQLNQVNETDTNLLLRLSNYYDAKFKATSGVLLFFLKDDFKTTSGEALTPINIYKNECSSWSFSHSDRAKYDGVMAQWRDNNAAQVKKVYAGKQSNTYIIKTIFASEQDAINKATTKYNNLLRDRIKGNITTAGNPKIASEFEVKLSGFKNNYNLKCESCSHTLDKNGYQTTLQVVNKK